MKRIEELRRAREWTQEELAERAGVAPQTISAYERDTRCGRLPTLRLIAEALGVHVTDLLSKDEEEGVNLNTRELVEVLLERIKKEYEGDPEKQRKLQNLIELILMETSK